MSFDIEASQVVYRQIFEGYVNEFQNIKDVLNNSYNFGRSATDTDYEDFWSMFNNPSYIPISDFTPKFDKIMTDMQQASDLISEKYMSLMGMMMSLNDYLCFSTDAMSRIVDTMYSFGRGSVYSTVTGVFYPETNSYEILKPGLEASKDGISEIQNDIWAIVNGMDRSLVLDANYLKSKRNQIEEILLNFAPILTDIDKELDNLVSLAKDTNTAITSWFPNCFRMLTTVSLSFNLGNKAGKVADKALITGSPINAIDRIGLSSAKYWREKVSADMSNRGECMQNAILLGLETIGDPGKLEAYIDLTWANQVPRYS